MVDYQLQKKSHSSIEKVKLTLGFMPLTDCAPLIVAKELGYFAKFGLNVSLSKENSWASMRDKLATNVLDAGQLLAPMPLAGACGFDPHCQDLVAPFVLSRNGNAITLSRKLFEAVNPTSSTTSSLNAKSLYQQVSELKKVGKKLTFATVYPYSCHYLQLISYFKQGGIDPNDINIVIISPVNMVSALRHNDIDGFCVGGPYNAKAVREGVGVTVATSMDIWPDLPEKVLAFKRQWYVQNPTTAYALISALSLACQWLSNIPNRFEAAKLLSQKQYINTPIDVIAPSLLGSCLTMQGEAPRSVDLYNRFTSSEDIFANQPLESDVYQLQEYFASAFVEQGADANKLTIIELKNIYSASIYQQAMDWLQQYEQACDKNVEIDALKQNEFGQI
ncbi:CmpA/NrtA family ABC transporter substrate-binding protein [Thalassomonas sp. M1454]|uniref:CmpA/NrtA family ABC transporter substrate-binding protein n=1 Tax=Thalassomonas sp. M1454 TaxID=2594477 RepID=UPI00117F47B3|nr:CmpA/NrtA family ABC transporter substrate-binding protein [Thalassomonas sp. M1454]TRX56570.1 ABC transporter substrate-binding protein [Thalassomonas sp. M1454]